MWIWMTLGSALLLGLYDIAKKKAVGRNGVLYVLLVATAISTLFMSPFLSPGAPADHLRLLFKAVLVTTSWISGLAAMKILPLTTASTLKASRPFLVVIFSIILFGEKLNLLQWAGVAFALTAMVLLSHSSRKEGIIWVKNRGVAYMALSILTGAASALYDKHIMAGMQPLFVQSWANLYVTALLAVCVAVKCLREGKEREKFRWDWTLVLIAVLITVADALYFFALKQDGALLAVVSLMRRSSVIFTFLGGWLLFREGNIRSKAFDLAVLLAGMVLLTLGSS